ncbi:MAG: DUF6268 family outer membrane beta-barrel protein [Planctomycetota bacterium]
MLNGCAASATKRVAKVGCCGLLLVLLGADTLAAQPTANRWLAFLPWSRRAGVEPFRDPFLDNRAPPQQVVPVAAALPTAVVADVQESSASDAVYLDQLYPPSQSPVRMAGLPDRTIPPSDEIVELAEDQPQLPPGARQGIFQRAYVTGTWAPQLGDESDTLGIGQLETGVVLGFPMMRPDTPLLVTPQFSALFLENAASVDLPSTLYEAAADFTHLRKFNGGPWAMNVGVTVGYYSDFQQDSGEAVRVTGRGLAVYESSAATQWVVGVAYLNRAGATVIPVAGVIYSPSDDVRLEATFPRPRVAWRTIGSREGDEGWFYVGGELGGGAWSVTRPSTGMLDFVNYRDFRALLGYERKIIGGLSRKFDVGYVFGREVQYDSATPDASLDDTLFVRTGLTY